MASESIGGQAVIEGVMMRNGDKVVTAVRKANGLISVRRERFESLTKHRPFSLPFVRGVIAFVEMLVIGIKSLNWSASISVGEESKSNKLLIATSFIFATCFALVLFKLLPLGIAELLSRFFSGRILFNIIEGISKIGILVAYIYVIGRMEDVKRIFMYHGAEHKAVNCYESGKALKVKNAIKFSTSHPRCGTSFIIIVFVISIIFYTLLPMQTSFIEKYLMRIALLPVIAGVSYEVLKFSSKQRNNLIVKSFTFPGLWLQRLTTAEPTKEQLDVALVALKKAIK